MKFCILEMEYDSVCKTKCQGRSLYVG